MPARQVATGPPLRSSPPPEQRQYPLMKRLTARTEHWDDRHCDHYQKYFLYLSPITVGGFCGSPWVESGGAGRRASCRGKFCGMELQLAARVFIHALKSNKGHVRRVLWSIRENDSSLVYIMSYNVFICHTQAHMGRNISYIYITLRACTSNHFFINQLAGNRI